MLSLKLSLLVKTIQFAIKMYLQKAFSRCCSHDAVNLRRVVCHCKDLI